MTEPIRVLLVDDHETVREGLRALFDRVSDMAVAHDASDGDQVAGAMAANPPDVVVMDLSMPTNGLVAMRRMREVEPRPPVVVLTRHRDVAYVREAFTAGATGYVLKQSSFTQLKDAIRAAARHERYIDEHLLPEVGADLSLMTTDGSARLSDRELEVLRLAALGRANKDIASDLSIAVKTVEVHKANGMRKLELHDRSDLLRFALLQGWLRDP